DKTSELVYGDFGWRRHGSVHLERGHGRDISAEALRSNRGRPPDVSSHHSGTKSISCALAGGRVEFPEVPQVAGRLGNEPVSEGDGLRERPCRLTARAAIRFAQS